MAAGSTKDILLKILLLCLLRSNRAVPASWTYKGFEAVAAVRRGFCEEHPSSPDGLTSLPGITQISNGFTRFATAVHKNCKKIAREATADDDSLGTLLTGVLGQSLDGDRLNAY